MEIQETRNYRSVKGLCDATLDQITPGNVSPVRPTLKQLKRWGATRYRREAVLDGKVIAFFYLSPRPDEKPEVVRLEALGTDPSIPYETQREAGFKLIRVAIDDYMKAGTKKAHGMGWVESAAFSICTDLGLPLSEGGVDSITREPIQYNVDEVPLTLVDELLKKQGL